MVRQVGHKSWSESVGQKFVAWRQIVPSPSASLTRPPPPISLSLPPSLSQPLPPTPFFPSTSPRFTHSFTPSSLPFLQHLLSFLPSFALFFLPSSLRSLPLHIPSITHFTSGSLTPFHLSLLGHLPPHFLSPPSTAILLHPSSLSPPSSPIYPSHQSLSLSRARTRFSLLLLQSSVSSIPYIYLSCFYAYTSSLYSLPLVDLYLHAFSSSSISLLPIFFYSSPFSASTSPPSLAPPLFSWSPFTPLVLL